MATIKAVTQAFAGGKVEIEYGLISGTVSRKMFGQSITRNVQEAVQAMLDATKHDYPAADAVVIISIGETQVGTFSTVSAIGMAVKLVK